MLFLSPVVSGYIKYTDLTNGSLTLFDLFILNDLIKYKTEYEETATEIYKERYKVNA